MTPARKAFLVGYRQYKRGEIDAGYLAWLAMLDAGLPPIGTESLANRRSAAARTAALARHSRK